MAGCGQKESPIREDMQIRQETLEIPGIQKEYHFLFLTDTHVIAPEETDNLQLQEYEEQRQQEFASQTEVNGAEQFEAWIDYANEQKADGLLLGGDIIDSPSSGNLDFLNDKLKKLEIPYLYTLGNHDWSFPWEYMTENEKNQYRTALESLQQDNTAIHSLELENLIITAVDNSSNQIAPEALEEYRQILEKGKPVIVMLHVPLLTQSVLTKAKETWKNPVVLGGGNYGGIYPDNISTEFIELTTAAGSPVVAVLAGHVHFADRDMINQNIVQIVGDGGYKGCATMISIVPRQG